jgi:hypothetical protein
VPQIDQIIYRDLWQLIGVFCDWPELYSLSLVSKAVRTIVLPELHRRIPALKARIRPYICYNNWLKNGKHRWCVAPAGDSGLNGSRQIVTRLSPLHSTRRNFFGLLKLFVAMIIRTKQVTDLNVPYEVDLQRFARISGIVNMPYRPKAWLK